MHLLNAEIIYYDPLIYAKIFQNNILLVLLFRYQKRQVL